MPALATRILARIPLIALVALTLCGCSDIEKAETPTRVMSNVQEADRYLTLGDPAQARVWFDRAVALDPHAREVYIGFSDNGQGGLIDSLTQHNDWPDIIRYLSAAVADAKLCGDWQLWSNLAQAQERVGDASAAKASYQKELDLLVGSQLARGASIAALSPDAFQIEKASAEWGAGKRNDAIADFSRVIARYPNLASQAQNSLAYSEAVANVNLPQAYALALAAVKTARDQGASDDSLGAFLDTLGWVEYRMGKQGDAARDLEEAIGDIPREPVSHYHLAMIYRAMGDGDDALVEIHRAAALDPSSADTQIALREMTPAPSPSTAKA